MLAHRTYTTESVKRLFASLEKGKAADFKPLGVLADYVEVDPQYEKPTEEFLHEELEYVVVENWEQAERGHGFHSRRVGGPSHVPGGSGPNGRSHGICRSRPSGPRPASPRGSANRRLTNGFKDQRDRPVAARFPVLSWRKIPPRRSGFRSAIRTSISYWPMAFAITATR